MGGVRLSDALILCPQLIKWNDSIPLAISRSVRQIADDAVNAIVWNHLHAFDAVHVVDVVNFNHIVKFLIVLLVILALVLSPLRYESGRAERFQSLTLGETRPWTL